MSLIVIFDHNTTPNKVISVDPTGSTDQFIGRPDALINPDVSGLKVPVKYWKHVAGSIVEMTAEEQATQDAAEAATAKAQIRNAGKALIIASSDVGIVERASADVMKDEINLLRQWLAAYKIEVAASTSLADLKTRVATLPATPDRTLAQFETAKINKIDSGTVDS